MVEKLQGKRKYVSFRSESSPKVAVFEEMRLHLPTFYAFDFLSKRKVVAKIEEKPASRHQLLIFVLRPLSGHCILLHHRQTPMEILLKTPANHI